MSSSTPFKSTFELFGPGTPPRNTHEKLLLAGLDLFHTYGFHAVGLDRILAEVGVTKTTFYNHFESKDELAVQAVKLRDRWDTEAFERDLKTLAGDHAPPHRVILACFDVIDHWFQSPDFEGCIFLNACHEFPNPADPVRQAARAHYLAVETMLSDLACQARAENPDVVAAEITLLIEGAFTMRQVSDRQDAAQVAQQLARDVLRRHLPQCRNSL